ncbi:hypothetical protein K7B09_12485 [Thermomonas sp. RSS23]|uniref:DUF4393 domain-containing protein n=1 Tax=Thermomonas beijingensis TaxID=2872701 RepID=A0ABS7TH32_9GAMM|nr:hypothetical protein [Thermomonas beijingensis]MBZ4187138.1 hypothetical protein [Thermomonas beijingensis]
MSEDEKKLAIALPGEWALQKTLGPVLSEIGDDLKRLYAKGRDKIIEKAYKKIENPEDGKSANLRIAHEALTSGAFTEEEICAEYFGGILAASRTSDGKSDDTIQLLDTIKSLSAKQLHLHYSLYNSLNRLLVSKGDKINVAQSDEINPKKIWLASLELTNIGLKIDTDFNILHRQGLVDAYETKQHPIEHGRVLPYSAANPTTYGVLLYSVAHNWYGKWRSFSSELFPQFEGIQLPTHYAFSIGELMESAGVKPAES